MEIKFATKKDYEELSSFCDNSLQTEVLLEILEDSSTTKIVIAIKDSKIVGKSILYILPWIHGKISKKRGIIAEVFVKKEYRRQGIAKAMMIFCINQYKENLEDIQIDRVSIDNLEAVSLYEKIFPKKFFTFGDRKK